MATVEISVAFLLLPLTALLAIILIERRTIAAFARSAGVVCLLPDISELPVGRPFIHKMDQHGMYHSLCSVCYQTVARAPRESRLIRGEEEHQCKGKPSLIRSN